MERILHSALALSVLASAAVGCGAAKSENPLSPAVAGPIAGVSITPPRPLEPAAGVKVKESQQPLKLVIENSTTSGQRPVTYVFEIASEDTFATKVYARSGIPQGDGGKTSITVDKLDLGKPYHWRVRAEDGANASDYAASTFEVLPKPVLQPPAPQLPHNGETTGGRRPELKTSNSQRNEAVGYLRYDFQIATDSTFSGIVAAGSRDEGGSTTEFIPDSELALNATHYWRVRSTDGETTSSWSAVFAFKTPAPAPPPTPIPAPGGGGGPCNSSSADAIIKCERAKYGFMSSGQIVEFLKASARSLNRNGIGGGPFGILRKSGGHQCNGYSCDIICSGQGTSQVQYDVLADAEGAQGAGWGGAHTWPNIRVDVCEIQ